MAGGITLLYLNGPVPFRIDPTERQSVLSLLPVLDLHSAGVLATARF